MVPSIEPFIHRKIVVLHESDLASQAAKAMTVNGIGSVIVTDHAGHVTGIVTDRDLVARVLAGSRGGQARLREVMTAPVAWVSENASIETVLRFMERHGVRRIPVLHEMRAGKHRCVGLVTLDDLIAAGAVAPERLRRLVHSQLLHRHVQGPRRNGEDETRASEEFVDELAIRLGTDETRARAAALFVFSRIARRLTASAAIPFILRLPAGFRDELFELPPGPDRLISAPDLVRGVAERLRIPPESAPWAVRDVWQRLERDGDPASLNHVLHQLPSDLQGLLREPEPLLRMDFQEWAGA